MTIALAIHGGCGVMSPAGQPEAEWAGARAALAEALRAGWRVLSDGGRALDAVEAAVVVLEDSPHFNAGHGAALNAEGEHELDSSIMDGDGRRAGAVIGVRRVRNPVRAARAVLEGGKAVILAGPAADAFAGSGGLELVDPSFFTIERQRGNLAAMKARGRDGTVGAATEAEKHGTVGAVALDGRGHLAAATSTGGYTNKPAGRVGDSPIPGAGTYAEDGVCAVSGTGQGEAFIRHALAHDVGARIRYRGDALDAAAAGVIADLTPRGTGAGLIALDAAGRVALPFNTGGMYRGWVTPQGEGFVATHGEVFALGRLGA
ncbi:isoaspartyl peptidase/L-asparaginase family protein [Lichenibacterium dinghuense]|uniref:isoaspartyl peptidase/L-asparaginase family protein n=1 Tax=Lichenibacterium dinghuense TaxID=2895977 RepID=UPI001F2EA856|nr:isoaspartyl peptidase/L-asparaginase [Lichenibacterium sp. 6Y81]